MQAAPYFLLVSNLCLTPTKDRAMTREIGSKERLHTKLIRKIANADVVCVNCEVWMLILKKYVLINNVY